MESRLIPNEPPEPVPHDIHDDVEEYESFMYDIVESDDTEEY